MTNVVLPPLGDGIEKATVTFWFFKAGDTVQKDQDLVELTTDKAAFNLPCPSSGVLQQIMIDEGAVARVGNILALIA
jgi:pyruvate/2-oxoglutarate dehydrogenase complex dihydrolipoamide acyltransferase (E2) component